MLHEGVDLDMESKTEQTGTWRRTYVAVDECPLEKDIPLEACRKCPHFIEYLRGRVRCRLLSGREQKMKPEPARDSEYKVKW